MKKNLFLLLSLCSVAVITAQDVKLPELHFNPPPRKIRINNKTKMVFAEKGKVYFGIVVPEDSGKPAILAADELATFLGRALNVKIPVAKQRDPKWRHAIILGDCTLSRKAGLNVKGLTRDGFLMRTVGRDIYIAGPDAKEMDTKMWISKSHYWGIQPFSHERGTVHGAYDFLERFAGIRFYLPVQLGIIVPKLTKLEIPQVDIFDRPDCHNRTTTGYTLMHARPGDWIEKGVKPLAFARYASLRSRAGTRGIPNCHGLQHLGYWKRFGKQHPEYFVKNNRGQRLTGYPGFICLSSGIINEIIEDAKSALRGEPPTKRGVLWTTKRSNRTRCHWFPMTYIPGFFNVHLMDAMQVCYCDKCDGANVKEADKWKFNADKVWNMTVEVAKAIKKAKIPGWITQMGYNHYREVPDIDIPDNVIVQLTFNGPFQMNEMDKMKYEYDLVKRWNKKLNGRKVWLWIYLDATDEGNDWCSFPGVSQNAPYTIAKYFRDQKDDISGSFVEIAGNPKDWINLHVSMRMMWDLSTDINKYMEEFYTLMFGKAAPILKPYFDEAEKLWIYKVRGASFETPLGPKPFKQTAFKTWEEFFPRTLIQKWVKIFDRAEAAVKNSPAELERVKFFRKYYLGPTLKHCELYWKNRSSTEILHTRSAPADTEIVVDGKLNDAAWKKAEVNYLAKFRMGETPIRATVKVLHDSKNLYFGFESIDPHNKLLSTGEKMVKGESVVSFSTFEVMLNPSGDKETVYHFLINPCGRSAAYIHPGDKEFKAKYQVKTHYGKDRWTAELVVPRDQIPNLKDDICYANFSYFRRINAPMNKESGLYTWSPYLQKRFYEPDHFGKIVFRSDYKSENILNNGYDFAGLKKAGRLLGNNWSFGERHATSKIYFDTKNFVTGGQSVVLESKRKDIGRASAAVHYYRVPKLEAGKKYRLSYYIKSELEKGAFFDARVWTNKTNVIPRGRLQGKFDWMKISGEFVSAPNGGAGIAFLLYGSGKVYVDHVVLQKID